MRPKVSIITLAYNHESFIRQALDSILMQKCSFDYEILIHDDASTDNTAKIIKEYEKLYPKIVKPIYQTENQFSKGSLISLKYNWNRILGTYVITNEGDDYFTDPYKLQKQVDFLDTHSDFSICFHPVEVIWEDGTNPTTLFPEPAYRFNKDILELGDLLINNFIQTNSCMYRWRFNENEKIADFFPKGILPGDYFLHLLHAEKGKIGFLPEVMAVYRKHSEGIWINSGVSDEWFIKYGNRQMMFYNEVEKKFAVNYTTRKMKFIQKVLLASFRNSQFNVLEELKKNNIDICNKVSCLIDKNFPEIDDRSMLFLNTGNGYNRDERIFPIHTTHNKKVIIKHFKLNGAVKSFRFDPIEGTPVKVKIIRLDSDAKEVKIIAKNATGKIGNWDEFLHLDPMYEISGNLENLTYINIEYNIETLSLNTSLSTLHTNTQQELTQIKTELTQIKTELTQIKTELTQTKTELTQTNDSVINLNSDLLNAQNSIALYKEKFYKSQEQFDSTKEVLQDVRESLYKSQIELEKKILDYETILNSRSWKITKPLRFITSLLKTLFKKK